MNRGQLYNVLSSFSMEMMDDDQIDQLMKETSLQETAEELVSNVVVRD